MEKISKQEAERLLQLYMEGRTNAQDMSRLRHYLFSVELPQEWEPYRLLLTTEIPDDGAALLAEDESDAYDAIVSARKKSRHLFLPIISSVAAIVAAVIFIITLPKNEQVAPHLPRQEAAVSYEQKALAETESEATNDVKHKLCAPVLARESISQRTCVLPRSGQIGKTPGLARAEMNVKDTTSSLENGSEGALVSSSNSILENVAKNHQQIAEHRQAVRQAVNDLLRSCGVGELCATE